MKVIYLIRHGQASFGERNYDKLSELGYEQSRLVAQYLATKDFEFDAVFSGTLTRQQETANAWLEQTTQTLNVDEQWNEFNHKELISRAKINHASKMNNLSGASHEKLLKLFTLAVNDWINPENDQYYSESWPAFNNRVQTALMASINSTAKTGLVFTSGGVIASIIGTAWQLTAEQSMKLNWTLVNTGITKLLVNDGKVRVSTVNEYPHLDNQQNKNKITYK